MAEFPAPDENFMVAEHTRISYGAWGGLLGSPGSFAEERRLKANAMEVLPRLVWHCGTPDPSPPPVEALTAAVSAALGFRAPPAG